MSPGADDGPRTRDLWLGKPTLYQLSYVGAVMTSAHCRQEAGSDGDEHTIPRAA
jgi:hypothetical protein